MNARRRILPQIRRRSSAHQSLALPTPVRYRGKLMMAHLAVMIQPIPDIKRYDIRRALIFNVGSKPDGYRQLTAVQPRSDGPRFSSKVWTLDTLISK